MSPKTLDPKNRRRSIRFRPDADVIATVDVEMKGEEFCPQLLALVSEESAKGCGLVLVAKDVLLVGDICRVQVGRLEPIKAEVRWRKVLDPQVFKVGLMYLE
jgi:hypothetical protein